MFVWCVICHPKKERGSVASNDDSMTSEFAIPSWQRGEIWSNLGSKLSISSPRSLLSFTNHRSSTIIMFSNFLVLVLLSSLSWASAVDHVVLVASTGLSYTPSQTNASVGDTVTFVFAVSLTRF